MRQQLLGAARNGRSAAIGAAGTTRTGRAAPRLADSAGWGGRRRAGARRCSPGRGAEDELGRGSPGPAAPHARRSMPRTRARKWRARGDSEGGGHRGPAGCASFDPEVELWERRLLIGRRQGGTNISEAGGGGGVPEPGEERLGHPCTGSSRPTGPCRDPKGERETEAGVGRSGSAFQAVGPLSVPG